MKTRNERRDTFHPLENKVSSYGPSSLTYILERKLSHASHHSHGEHATLETRIRSASISLLNSLNVHSHRETGQHNHEHNIQGKKIAS